MVQELTRLSNKISLILDEAERAKNAYGSELENVGWQPALTPGGSFDDPEAYFNARLEDAFRELKVMAELLGLVGLHRQIDKKEKELRASGFSDVTPDRVYSIYVSKTLDAARDFYKTMNDLVDSRSFNALEIFHSILKNSDKIVADIVADGGALPCNEADVRRYVFRTLKYAFPDVEREVVISHPNAKYQADFGVSSLHALAEFKYVDDAKKLHSTIDGLLADMHGYENDEWHTVYGVIYMNGPYCSQDEINAKLASMKAPKHWKVFRVVGPGAVKKS